MSPTVGTTAVVASALRVPERTIRWYAKQGWITNHGTARRAQYDALEVAVVRAAHGPAQVPGRVA